MKPSKIRAALFLIHLRIEIAVSIQGWHDYMCHSSAKTKWVGVKRTPRALILKRINARFVSIKLGRLPNDAIEAAAWEYDPIGSICARNRELIAPTRKELFQFWKKDLLKKGL